MRARITYAAIACLLCLGLAGIAFASEAGHKEPKNTAAACATSSATVSWSAVDDAHLSGYDVYKKVHSDSMYTRVNNELVTATTYLVTGLSSGTTYDFAVMAMYNDGHTSVLSTPATCTTG